MSHRTSCAERSCSSRSTPARPSGKPAAAAGARRGRRSAAHRRSRRGRMETPQERRAARRAWRRRRPLLRRYRHLLGEREAWPGTDAHRSRGPRRPPRRRPGSHARRRPPQHRNPRHRSQRTRRPGVRDRDRPLHRPTAVRTVLAPPAPHRSRATAADGPPRWPPRRHPHVGRSPPRRRHRRLRPAAGIAEALPMWLPVRRTRSARGVPLRARSGSSSLGLRHTRRRAGKAVLPLWLPPGPPAASRLPP